MECYDLYPEELLLKIVSYGVSYGDEWMGVTLWRTAKMFGSLVKTLPRKSNVCKTIASRKNSIRYLLHWITDDVHKWTTKAINKAAREGDLNTLSSLLWNKYPHDEKMLHLAAKSGHLEILQYLVENKYLLCYGRRYRYRRYDKCIRYAASGGHLDLVKWLRSMGCAWDEKACYEAAKGGHLYTLIYLRRHKCPWNVNQCLDVAQRKGHKETYDWIHTRRNW